MTRPPAGCQPNRLPPSAAADLDPTVYTPETYHHYPPGGPHDPAPAPSTSLGTHELNAQWTLNTPTPYERYRHDEWTKTRKFTAASLERLATSPKVLAKFCSCGSGAVVVRHKSLPGLYRVRCAKCRHRLCFPCQRERGCIIAHNLEHLARSAGHNLSLLTLTLKHSQTDLRAQLTRLLTSFRELRRCLLWKRNVIGAAYTVEIKVGKDGRWHPHLHCLLHSRYMEQGHLSAAWLTATGDSSNVDIRRMNAHRGARYISKYVVKPTDESVLRDATKFEEFILATHRLRKCSTLGTWRGCPLAEHEQDEELLGTAFDLKPENWIQVDDFDNLLKRIKDGDTTARAIFHKLGLRPQRGPP